MVKTNTTIAGKCESDFNVCRRLEPSPRSYDVTLRRMLSDVIGAESRVNPEADGARARYGSCMGGGGRSRGSWRGPSSTGRIRRVSLSSMLRRLV